jgi:hypothetical protein
MTMMMTNLARAAANAATMMMTMTIVMIRARGAGGGGMRTTIRPHEWTQNGDIMKEQTCRGDLCLRRFLG